MCRKNLQHYCDIGKTMKFEVILRYFVELFQTVAGRSAHDFSHLLYKGLARIVFAEI